MRSLLLILFSLSYIVIWGMLCLDTWLTQFSVFMAMLYSCFSVNYVVEKWFSDNKRQKYLIFIGPGTYLIAMFALRPFDFGLLFHPILWCCIFFTISFFVLKTTSIHLVAIICFFSYLYAYHIYNYCEQYSTDEPLPSKISKAQELDGAINLNKFTFLHYGAVNKKIDLDKKYTVVETWNETCPPCIAAIKDLDADFAAMSDSVAHKYLYVPPRHTLDTAMIFSAPIMLPHKNDIMIDVGAEFFKKTKMNAYPYFLVFRKDGSMIDYIKGYNADKKDEFITTLQAIMQK